MRVDGNAGATIGYQPNSQSEWQDQPELAAPPLPIQGDAGHWDHRTDDDYFSQPGALFRLMKTDEQQRLFDNTARSLGGASEPVQQRHVANCMRADPAYGGGVREALAQVAKFAKLARIGSR